MRVAIALPTGGLVLGCAVGVLWPDAPSWFLVASLILAALIAAWAFGCERLPLFTAGVVLSFAAGGALLAVHRWQEAWRPTLKIAFDVMARDERHEAARAGRIVPEEDTAAVMLVGVLRRDAAPTSGGGVALDVDVRRIGRLFTGGARDPAAIPVSGGVLLTVAGVLAGDRAGEWRAGRAIRAPAQIRRPSIYLDPDVANQERLLARRGVALVGTVKSGALVEVESRGSLVAEAAASVRAFARAAIASAVGRWSPRAAAIVTAIVIGDRSGLDASVERRLQEAGTYHVIAISGGNIAILAGLTLAVFRFAGFFGRSAMVSAMAGLVAYGYLVGGGASVNRATLMAVVQFAGRAIDLRGPPWNALFLAAGLMLVGDPLAIVDPGFLLTFGATAAILGVAGEIGFRDGGLRLAAPLVSMLLASAAAEAALLPVGAVMFSRVTFAGLALNLCAIPLMAVAQVAGMLVVPFYAAADPLASAAGWCAYFGAEGLIRTADLVALAPVVAWRVAPPSAWVVAVYYGGGGCAWCLWRRRRRVAGSAEASLAVWMRRSGAVLAATAAIWIVAEPWTLLAAGDGRLHVTFIDVGQGDAAFVRFPRGATLLVDAGGLPAGGTFDVGDRVVGPVLRRAGVRRLSTIALTHGDADHVGGASAAVLEFRPWDAWEGVPVPGLPALVSIHGAQAAVGTQLRTVQSGDVSEIDDVSVVVRHPRPPDWERQKVRNDDSIVLELAWRDVSIVLAGDIGAETEREIAPQFHSAPLRVLKVPHHGSLTSSSTEFLQALNPRVAVISVGRSNRFGHPSPVVLKRYEEIHAEVFRTDRDGAVTIDTDGRALEIGTFTGRRTRIQTPLPNAN